MSASLCMAWSGSCDPFLKNFALIISLELVKLGTSNFVWRLMYRSTSACRIYYPQKGCVRSHVTSLNLRK